MLQCSPGNTDDYMAAMDLPPTDSDSDSESADKEEEVEATSSQEPGRCAPDKLEFV